MDFILLDSSDECWRNLDTVLLRDGYVPRAQFNFPHTEFSDHIIFSSGISNAPIRE